MNAPERSLADRIARLPSRARGHLLAALGSEDARLLMHAWRFWGRPAQFEPAGDWDTWLVLAGRGFGKTRTGGQWVNEKVQSGEYFFGALIAPTAADARDTMVEKVSGVVRCADPDFAPEYEPSKRLLTWPPIRGARPIATLFSAEEPERLRGPEHDFGWLDEFGAYGANARPVWDHYSFGLRHGPAPKSLITTTGRPLEALIEIRDDPRTKVTRGNTNDNRANLPSNFLRRIARYEGTRLGLQELDGDILEDAEGALFKASWIESNRRARPGSFKRIVVSVDPAITARKGSDKTGVIVAAEGHDGRYYVLEDLSGKHSVDDWPNLVIAAYHRWEADCVVAETNRGGDLVAKVLRQIDKRVPVRCVHARRDKQTRAEPIAALYRQGRVVHVLGVRFEELEKQMTTWSPDSSASPDRLDALVWALWYLDDLDSGLGRAGEYETRTAPGRLATGPRVSDDEDPDARDDDEDDRAGSRW